MLSLRAEEDTLVWYWALEKDHLKDSTLAWFWTMDMQRDVELNNWMSEFYRGHWLRAKALKDRWEEEMELLRAGGK
ncbi:hypothetical protein PAXRUDRAFT_21868 [Paxillus rubicundulus Ve08.2h10]|uniref:Uncharacterized protein n=1 Tax=Paxillus rubicundulus Ve08.2h10 TaxID=930991 RepID=A0A0D0CP12_9AGAM|nr:hypothetical protein PAXRUDRAFT_21868 [Paxillus rubicundulus Ve08.2h10]